MRKERSNPSWAVPSDAVLDILVAGTFAYSLLRFTVIAALLGAMMNGQIGWTGFFLLLLKPFVLAAATAFLIRIRYLHPDRGGWFLRVVIFLAYGGVLMVHLKRPWSGIPISAWAAMILFFFAPIAIATYKRWHRLAPMKLPLLAAWSFGCGALALALAPAQVEARTNKFGLISKEPNHLEVVDFSGQGNKDNYPVCRFQHNSLGYRDMEPPAAPKRGERRILIVGDSHIWGAGIRSNEETLGYRLRGELEKLATGRFLVMSAAYPGLGLYGYGRFIDEISPRYSPDIVVVGYLGENDHDPLDAQFQLDHLPSSQLLRNLVLNLGAAQHLHEASVIRGPAFWRSAKSAAFFKNLYEEFARKAVARGYRLLFLRYYSSGESPLPQPIELLDLSGSLRYPGRANNLWYGKDSHPKPALNLILARILAARIAGGLGHRTGSSREP